LRRSAPPSTFAVRATADKPADSLSLAACLSGGAERLWVAVQREALILGRDRRVRFLFKLAPAANR
jgi:hypothetical protein